MGTPCAVQLSPEAGRCQPSPTVGGRAATSQTRGTTVHPPACFNRHQGDTYYRCHLGGGGWGTRALRSQTLLSERLQPRTSRACRGGGVHEPGTVVVFIGTQGQGGSGTGPTQDKMQSASQSPVFVLNSTSVPAGHFLWRRSWLWRGTRRAPPARFPEEALDPLETHRVVHCLRGILARRASVIVSV